jgi:hypothetical protein
MEQFIYKAICKTDGCPNAYLRVDIVSEGYPTNVICGPCENEILDIIDPVPFVESE